MSEKRHQPQIGTETTSLLLPLAIWFPFHPAGYALGLSTGMVWVWRAVCVGWFIKAVLLKFGGLRTYRKASPFFVGVILGDFLIGMFWGLVGAVFEIPVYRVWY